MKRKGKTKYIHYLVWTHIKYIFPIKLLKLREACNVRFI